MRQLRIAGVLWVLAAVGCETTDSGPTMNGTPGSFESDVPKGSGPPSTAPRTVPKPVGWNRPGPGPARRWPGVTTIGRLIPG